MTTTFSVLRKCSRCGKYSNFTKILRESAFASFDLDDRPSDYDRDALQYKVQECPHCGYAADDISFGTTAPDALFESEEYLSYGGIPFLSELAKKFYRLYLVERAVGDVEGAFYAALHGAWASDDALDVAAATKCRRLALEQLEILESRASNPEGWTLTKFDLLRRVRDFDAVVEGAMALHSDSRYHMNIAALELELAKRGDDACHTYAEVDGYDDEEDEDEDEDEIVDEDFDEDEDCDEDEDFDEDEDCDEGEDFDEDEDRGCYVLFDEDENDETCRRFVDFGEEDEILDGDFDANINWDFDGESVGDFNWDFEDDEDEYEEYDEGDEENDDEELA